MDEKVWLVVAKRFVRGDVKRVVRELERMGFTVESNEVIFEYE